MSESRPDQAAARDESDEAGDAVVRFAQVTRRLYDQAWRLAVRGGRVAGELRAGDSETMARLRAEACELEGVDLGRYIDALAAAPDLATLERHALHAALTDNPDAGPWEQLSSRDPAASWHTAADAADVLRGRFDPEASQSERKKPR